MAAIGRERTPEPSGETRTAGPSPSLQAAVEEAVAQERQRLAKLLHNSVSQSLTGAYFQSQVLMKILERAHPEEARQVAELGEMIHRGVVELADITRSLHKEG